MGAATVAQTTAGVITQAKAAKAQTKAIRSQQEVVAEENRKATSAELFDQMRASRREAAKVRTAAGEAGLGLNSGSIDGILFDTAMQLELQTGRSIANMESRHAANTSEAESALSQIQKPTLLGAGLQIGASAAGAWSGVQGAKLQTRVASAPTVSTGA